MLKYSKYWEELNIFEIFCRLQKFLRKNFSLGKFVNIYSLQFPAYFQEIFKKFCIPVKNIAVSD